VTDLASSPPSSVATLRSLTAHCQSCVIDNSQCSLTSIRIRECWLSLPIAVITSSTRTRRTYSSHRPTDREATFLVGATRRVELLACATRSVARADLSFLRPTDNESGYHSQFLSIASSNTDSWLSGSLFLASSRAVLGICTLSFSSSSRPCWLDAVGQVSSRSGG
jgi:hypothetical protein